MLEPSDLLKEYIETDTLLKQIEERKKRLRPLVIEELSKEDYAGISLSKKQITLWNDEEFYNWVAQMFPEHLEAVSKKVIDYEKFEELTATRQIEYEELPSSVYKIRTDNVIHIKDRRNAE